MFKNLKKNKVIHLTVHTEETLTPYWEILREVYEYDLLRNISDNPFLEEIICNVESISQTKPEEKKQKKDELFNTEFGQFCKEIKKEILSSEKLKKSNSESTLFLIKEPFVIVYDNNLSKEERNSSFLKEPTNWFSQYKILTYLIDKASNNSTLFDCIKEMETSGLYANLFGKDDSISPLLINSPIYPISLFERSIFYERNFTKEDLQNIWINKIEIEKKYQIQLGEYTESDCSFLFKKEKDVDIKKAIGILVNQFLFVLSQEVDKFISKDKLIEYYWCLFEKNVFTQIEKSKRKSVLGELSKQFLESTKKEVFSNLLSNLKYNLYIDDEKDPQKIPDGCDKYFHRLVKFDSIEDLKNYELFVHDADADNKTIFGAYNKVRSTDDSSYNLKYLVEHISSKKNHFWTKSVKVDTFLKKKKIVKILRPEIAYFFIEKFYEEFMSNVLKEIRTSNSEVDFVSNYNVESSGEKKHEIDFVIKSKKKLFFVECKTRLNTIYINNYIKKCKQWSDDFKDIASNIEFVIVGCYSSPELDVFRYNIKDEDEVPEDYNKPREGLNGIPYYFKVPIMETDKNLICVTESSFDKLVSTMTKILDA